MLMMISLQSPLPSLNTHSVRFLNLTSIAQPPLHGTTPRHTSNPRCQPNHQASPRRNFTQLSATLKPSLTILRHMGELILAMGRATEATNVFVYVSECDSPKFDSIFLFVCSDDAASNRVLSLGWWRRAITLPFLHHSTPALRPEQAPNMASNTAN